MRNATRFLLLVIVGTAIGMILDTHGPIGSRIYPVHTEGIAQPTGLLTPVLVAGTLAQALGLGVALALAANARRAIAALELALPGRRLLATASFVALLWILASWIPHISLHQSIHPANLWALAAIEWGFHVTIVTAACILARYVQALASALPRTRAQPEADLGPASQA